MLTKHWIFLLKLILTLSLLYAVYYYVDVSLVWQHILAINPWYLLAAWLCIVVGYVLCGLRWAWMAQGLGIEVSRKQKIKLYFLGMFTSLFLPSTIGGDVVRGILLAKGEGRQGLGLSAAASVILDRLNGMYALISLLTISMFFFSWPMAWWVSWMMLVIGMWVGLLLYPWFHVRLPQFFNKIKSLPLHAKRFQKMWWRSLPVSFVFQAMVVQAHVFLAMAVGLEMNWFAISNMVGLVALVATLPISLNGFGIREAGYVGFAVYFGASSESATAMAALWIIVLSLAALPGAFILWRLGGLKALKLKS